MILSLSTNSYMVILAFAGMIFFLQTAILEVINVRKQCCSFNAFKYSFRNTCIDTWNSLPGNVNAATLYDFIRKLNNVNLIRY